MHSKAAARHQYHDGESVSLKMLVLQREENTILSPLLLFVVTSCYWLLLHVVTGCLLVVTSCYWMLLLNKSREGSGLRFMHAKAASRNHCHDGETVLLKMLFLQREENTILSPMLLFVVTSCYWLLPCMLLLVVTTCYQLLLDVTVEQIA